MKQFIVLLFLALYALNASATMVVNVNIADGAQPDFSGQGAYAAPGNDYWTRLGWGLAQNNLLASDGVTASGINITLAREAFNDQELNPENFVANNSSHGVLRNYYYARTGSATITDVANFRISGLVPNRNYTLYLYSQGQGDGQGAVFTVNGVSAPVPTGTPPDRDEYSLGDNYVVVQIAADGDGIIQGHWTQQDGQTFAAFNGLQIIESVMGAKLSMGIVPGEKVEVSLDSQAGVTYRLEYTTDLTADPVDWNPADEQDGTGSTLVLEDDSFLADPMRIYRVEEEEED